MCDAPHQRKPDIIKHNSCSIGNEIFLVQAMKIVRRNT
ncbi:hypothetical protein APV28_4875 [Comamonas testosteroni]|nr:hypothetical protein APV28_4875 [Comamonas testosteroni]